MQWLELSVRVPQEAVEAVAALFYQVGHGGVAIEENVEPFSDRPGFQVDSTQPVLVRTYVPLDDESGERRRQVEEGLWHLGRILPVGRLETRQVAEEDWAEAWKAHYHLQRIGCRLVVKPSWEEYSPSPEEIVIELDPGMAFGTGLHPTTRLCLIELERRLRPGSTVLDLGTGSGILAIAAARLGAASVLALDVDPVAVEAAKENVARNGVEDVVTVEAGTLSQNWDRDAWSTAAPGVVPVRQPGEFDLVLANLVAQILVDLAPELARALKPGGTLLAGGIIEDRLPSVVEAFRQAGLSTLEVVAEGDWRTIVGIRNTEQGID